MSLLDKQYAEKRLRIMEQAWDKVAASRIALPKNRSQRDMWTRLMRSYIRQMCSLSDLECFPKGPFEYVKAIVDNGVFMDRGKV